MDDAKETISLEYGYTRVIRIIQAVRQDRVSI
jgi:hypothetical protein